MKKWLPIKLKQWLWWIFKSPQRKVLGMGTLLIDLRGYYTIWGKRSKHLEPVTVCIGIKNRSENLLNHVIPSLNQCLNLELISLSIYDAGSDDIDALEMAIRDKWQGKLIYNKAEQLFTRSKTFNEAILQSETELIMACDADISLPKDLVKKINQFVTAKSAWFPQVWWLAEDKKSGRFFSEGTGIFASTRANFLSAGKYDEGIKEWGKEDWLLFFGFYKNGVSCIRTNELKMIHLPHQSMKPEGFVKLF